MTSFVPDRYDPAEFEKVLPPDLVVVKVGGSLFDHPALGPGLRAFLDGLAYPRAVLVPGGGPAADVVRDFDRTHRLGEEKAHWLALASLWITGDLVRSMIPGAEWVDHPRDYPSGRHVLDAYAYCRLDDTLPHTWQVTTDSIAAHAAIAYRASRLILLKSTDIPPDTPWEDAAARGWVDAYFPTAVAGATFPIEAVNFRKWLGERFPPAGRG